MVQKRPRRFSGRHGHDQTIPQTPIVEDAPEWLRADFVQEVLSPLLYIDLDKRSPNTDERPLGIKRLNEAFTQHLRGEMESADWDSWHCESALVQKIKSVAWFHFFDFIELVGDRLRAWERESFLHDADRFGFRQYLDGVNELFIDRNVGWELSADGHLVRRLPDGLTTAAEALATELQATVAPAHQHYRKAHRYLHEHPVDYENAIKEIVSAVESVARTIFPKASTLGDALKLMRKENFIPHRLVELIEKLYAFACSEPAVRHGAAVSSRVERIDAEFAFYAGVASIRYLVDTANRVASSSNSALQLTWPEQTLGPRS